MKQTKTLIWMIGGFIIAALALTYGYVVLFVTGCPLRAVTGIPCPGCGMTRAYLSLLRGDWQAAWQYHPLFWLVPAALLTLSIKKGPLASRKGRAVLWTAIAAAFILVYLIRLLCGDSF